MIVFLDTNIILDIVLRREPFVEDSQALLALAERGALSASVSALTFNNLYYVARPRIGRAKSIKALAMLRDICAVVPLNGQIVNQAIDSSIGDFEDGTQYFSALHAQADYLITRNVKDFPGDDIPVLTPAAFLTLDLDIV
jgi:predicted nucleic acid-binding protein